MEYDQECPICLEVCGEDSIKPYECQHVYHIKCSHKLASSHYEYSNKCLLCMKNRRKYNQDLNGLNYIFNNMIEGERDFDLNKYISKWKRPSCIKEGHQFEFETLGDWDFKWNNGKCCEKFTYTRMLVTCKDCHTDILI